MRYAISRQGLSVFSNQQLNLRVADLEENEMWAYIAGFFDGEGHVSVIGHFDKRYQKYFYIMHIGFTNTNKEIIHKLIEWIDEQYSLRTYKKLLGNAKMVYKLYYSGVVAKRVLEKMLPYIVVKKEKAIIALKFPVNKMGYNVRLTQSEKELQMSTYTVLRSLNKQGERGL